MGPFTWGPGGQKLTAAQAKNLRDVATALAARKQTPQNLGQGFDAIGDALLYNANMGRAGEAEAAGQAEVAQALAMARAGGDPSAFYDVLGSEWATPAQQLVAGSMMDRQYAMADRADERAYNAGLLADERAYEAPLRDAQLEGYGLQNETARLGLDQSRTGYRSLTDPAERAAFGITPDDTGLYQVDASNQLIPIGGKGAGITINTGDGNSSAFLKAADEKAVARLDAITSDGQNAAKLVGDLKTLAAIAPQIETGKWAELQVALGPYAQGLGFDIAGLPEMEAYKGITDRLAPQMRPIGSGSSSDRDVSMFLSSLPSLGRTSEGNQIITQTLSALQQHKIAAAEIAELAYIPKDQGGITWQEAEKRIRELPDPYEGFNEYRRDAEKANQAAAPTTQEEFDALPPGALYIDPDDGMTYRKR